MVEFILESALGPVKVHRQMQGQDKSQQRYHQGKHADVTMTPRQQQQQERARQRDEGHQRENDGTPAVHVHGVKAHRVPIQIM